MLEFRDVTVTLGGVRVLRDVSFLINTSDTVALIGANGAGKTTTLRSIMGFTHMTGEIRFLREDITKLPPAKRPGLGIGYAAEDRRLFSAFTVEENILMPAQVARLTAQETTRRLGRVYTILPELKEMAGRPAGSVSGGQGKMVALGRALMIGTRLIMLDEPFQGLAPALARRYAEALRTLRDHDPDVTLIITESNPGLLRRFADRALVVERGEMREGSLAEDAPDPLHPASPATTP
ncbi:ABC transporter ATP-binding protein [Acuticoccus mangrovi]|uniref:ATP-binding cassette domain-containing protein n=1 Tax=Acuticoccus mangrovi TaxID=2796142 RepID=A0A934MHS9_9HYPH|nr:ATP-binding cassette domain-containing protein [Acuticoccus mangrovi]MBJ3778003.1 ATP-binding cassette domain-containing protein [Acuticoccus mangrovi]